MATRINSFIIYDNVNEIAINFASVVSGVRYSTPTDLDLNKIFLEGRNTATDEDLSLVGSEVTGLGSFTVRIRFSEYLFNRLKNQTDVFDGGTSLAATGLYFTDVDAVTPALETAGNIGNAIGISSDSIDPDLVNVHVADGAFSGGVLQTFTLEFNKPIFNLAASDLTVSLGSLPVPDYTLTTSTLEKNTLYPKFIKVTVSAADATEVTTRLQPLNGSVKIPADTLLDWTVNNTNPNTNPDAIEVVQLRDTGTIALTNPELHANTDLKVLNYTLSESAAFVDPTNIFLVVLGVYKVPLRNALNTTTSELDIGEHDWAIIANNFARYGTGTTLPSQNNMWVEINDNATYPQSYQFAPAALTAFTADSTKPVIESLIYYTGDPNGIYNAILEFNEAIRVLDITKFVFSSDAAGTANRTNLTSGSRLEWIDGSRYGLVLDDNDRNLINAFAGSDSTYFGLEAAAIQDIYATNSNDATNPFLLASLFYESVTPRFQYELNEISVSSNSLVGQLNLQSSQRPDAVSFRAKQDTLIGGNFEFGTAPTDVNQGIDGKVLTILDYDLATPANPTYSLGWEDPGVSRIVAGNNITVSNEVGTVVIESTGGTGSEFFSADTGATGSFPTSAQINTAIGSSAAVGALFLDTSTRATNVQPMYVCYAVNSGISAWRSFPTTAV